MALRNFRGRGFALVEILVLVAILGLFSSWYVPLILSAREAARMATCRDNLRKIGLAAHSYHKTHGQFPPGVLANSSLDRFFISYWPNQVQQMVGVHLFLSPYYEGGAGALETVEKDLGTLEVDYEASQDELQPFWAPENNQAWGVAQWQFSQLICPSVGTGPILEGYIVGGFYQPDGSVNTGWLISGSNFTLGRTDYLGCSGYWGRNYSEPSSIDGRPLSDFAGVFGIRTKTSLTDITDGASNTYLFGEAPGVIGENIGANGESDGHVLGNAWIANATLSTGFGFDPSTFDERDEGDPDGATYRAHWTGFASLHPVILHWLYADGSVHALSKFTDQVVIRNMSGFADGAAVDPPIIDKPQPRK